MLFLCCFIPQWRGSWPSRIYFCPPSPNRAVKTAQACLGGGSISELNPDTSPHRWAGSREDQCWHPLMSSGSYAADGDTHSSNPSSPRQAVSVSNGLWMQQEKPAQPGRAVALLHCSAAMTVTKSGTKLFASNTKSIAVSKPGRNYNCSISPLDFIFITETWILKRVFTAGPEWVCLWYEPQFMRRWCLHIHCFLVTSDPTGRRRFRKDTVFLQALWKLVAG